MGKADPFEIRTGPRVPARAPCHPNATWPGSIPSVCCFLSLAWSVFRAAHPRPHCQTLEQPAPVVIQPPPPPPSRHRTKPEDVAQSAGAPPRVVTSSPLRPESICRAHPWRNPRCSQDCPGRRRSRRRWQRRRRYCPPNEPPESTGQGGERPAPPYPQMAQQFGQQGTVELLLTADEAGLVHFSRGQGVLRLPDFGPRRRRICQTALDRSTGRARAAFSSENQLPD